MRWTSFRALSMGGVGMVLILTLGFEGAGLKTAQAQSVAQAPPAGSSGYERKVIVLDAAHGGSDIGAQISEHVLEKDVTLALAVRLRSLLAARGFAVVLTRDSDTAISTDQRAEAANRAHAVACLVLHATASGVGVHLATSALNPIESTAAGAPVPWDDAQAAYLTQSQKLAAGIGDAVTRSQVPLISARAWMRPLDNLTCAAVSVEVAPLGTGSDAAPVTEQGYQQRVSEAIAGALILWRNQASARAAVAAPGMGQVGDAGATR